MVSMNKFQRGFVTMMERQGAGESRSMPNAAVAAVTIFRPALQSQDSLRDFEVIL